MTWASTAWGKVCVDLHAYLLPEYPALVRGIGQDEFMLHEGRTRLLFLGPSMFIRSQTIDVIVPDERLEATTRGAAPPGRRALWDRVCPVLCRIAVPFAGSETTEDTSQEACENVYERFLAGLNQIAHIRASAIDSAKWHGGSIGRNGTAVDVSFSLRFVVHDKPLVRVKPTSTAVAAVESANPAGQTNGVMVPGDV